MAILVGIAYNSTIMHDPSFITDTKNAPDPFAFCFLTM